MWLFGHLGPGTAAIQKLKPGLPITAVAIGTILPDLIDKPLYYGLRLLTGAGREGVGLITCTRTIGHSGIFLIALSALYLWKRNRIILSIAIGAATHHLLDLFQDIALGTTIPWNEKSEVLAFLFPLYKQNFGSMPFANLSNHFLAIFQNPHFLWSEIVGLVLFTYAVLRNRSTWRKSKSDR